MIDVDNYIKFITEHNMTEHQFLMLWLVHTKDYKNVARYKKAHGDFNVNELERLIEKGWIEDFGIVKDNVRTYNIADFLVSDKFTEVVHIDKYDAMDELWSAYPNYVKVGPTQKGVAKATDPDKLGERYYKIIKGNRQKHNEIVNIIKRMKQKNPLAPMKIETFVVSRHWEILMEEESTGNSGNSDLLRNI